MKNINASISAGPSVAALTHHLALCPHECLSPPAAGGHGLIQVAAVVADLLHDIKGASAVASPKKLAPFSKATAKDGGWLSLVLLSAWLLHHDGFARRPELADAMLDLLTHQLQPLAAVITAEQCVLEPDRREELARYCLSALGLLPADETRAQAEDRLSALNSIERERIIRETHAAEERARKVREAMEEKKARKAAAKAMRE